MNSISKVLVGLLALGLVAACSSEPEPDVEPDPDAGLRPGEVEDVGDSGDVEDVGDSGGDGMEDVEDSGGDGMEDVEDVGDGEDIDDGEGGEEFAEDCSVVLEVSDGLLILPETWPEAIPADVRPLICWEVREGVAEPDPGNGWQILVEREETASGDISSGEWFITGLGPSVRQVHYGVCDVPNVDCFDFKPLSAGTYFIHLLEPNNSTGPGASLVVEVE